MSTNSDILVKQEVVLFDYSQYNVIMHDNDVTSFEEVVFILCAVFGKSESEAEALTRQIDSQGSAVCGVYDEEIADTKITMVEETKQALISMVPHRRDAIAALKVSKEQI